MTPPPHHHHHHRPHQRPTLLRLSPPPYQIDFSTATTGRHLPTTKRRIRFRFGFADPHSLSNNLTGINCRGEEHEIQLIWSVASGKRRILLDGEEVHRSYHRSAYHAGGVSLPPDGGRFVAGFDMNGGEHHVEIVAHSYPPGCPFGDVRRKRERQYDMILDGQSFFDFPRIYELGLRDHHHGLMGRSFTYRSHNNRDLVAAATTSTTTTTPLCGSTTGTAEMMTSPRSQRQQDQQQQPVDDISVRYQTEEDDYETYDGIPSRFDPGRSDGDRSFVCPSPPTWDEQREYDRAYYDAEVVKARRNFSYRGDLNENPHVAVDVPPPPRPPRREFVRQGSTGSTGSTISQLSGATIGGTSSRTERVTASASEEKEEREREDPEETATEVVPEVATADLLHLDDHDGPAVGGQRQEQEQQRRLSPSTFAYLHEAFSSFPGAATTTPSTTAPPPPNPDPFSSSAAAGVPTAQPTPTPATFPSTPTSHPSSYYPPYTGEDVGGSAPPPSPNSPSRSVADEILGEYFKRPKEAAAAPHSGPLHGGRSEADEILGRYFHRPDGAQPSGPQQRQRRPQPPPRWRSFPSSRTSATPSLQPVVEEKKEGFVGVGGGGGSTPSTSDEEDEESPEFVVHHGDGRGGGGEADALDAALRKLVDLNDMSAGSGIGGGRARRRNSIPPSADHGRHRTWQQQQAQPSLDHLRSLRNGGGGGMGTGHYLGGGSRPPVMGPPPPVQQPPAPGGLRTVPYTYY